MGNLKQYLIDEFIEDYVERKITRREALRLLVGLTGSLFAATNILAACTPQPDTAPQVPLPSASPSPAAPSLAGDPKVGEDDPSIRAERVEFQGRDATLIGYVARPARDGTFSGVLVCHENRGLTDHIKDVTRRLAKAGYAGLAVDLLSREGGTDKVSDTRQIPGILGNQPEEQFVNDFQSGWSYLRSSSYIDKNGIGMVGFCFGGGVTWLVAAQTPEMRAAVPFYGTTPPIEEAPKINAAVLGIYAERDQRINSGIPGIEEAMKQHGKTFEKIIYPNAGHAFHNDTGGSYSPEAARDAWSKTIAWFDRYLKA